MQAGNKKLVRPSVGTKYYSKKQWRKVMRTEQRTSYILPRMRPSK